MKFPIALHLDMTRYLIQNGLRGNTQFPLVLMLEPTHRCNLQCPGCGRIREYHDTLNQDISLDACLASVDECPAPVVTVTGGEPLLYPAIGQLVQEILKKGRHIYLCTNAVLLGQKLSLFRPNIRFTFNVHLDGPMDVHDKIIGQAGVFERAMAGIREAKKTGFRVTTNTTLYRETEPEELDLLFHILTQVGVDGMLIAPAFEYEVVEEELFLTRDEIIRKFREIEPLISKYNVISTPLYVDFLMGRRNMKCTPWGNPTRNPRGWKSPCYLITDGHYETFQELMKNTDWDHFASGEDPRCRHCMMHCGYEPTVVRGLSGSLSDLWRMILWNLH
jgi:hopanoid biosynthesis associated radical SAM protein HpnH